MDKLILGTAQLGMKYGIMGSKMASKSERVKILETARRLGIRMIDTAENYGESQSIIGEYHATQDSFKFVVQTKFACGHSIPLSDQVEKDLEQLHVTSLEAYMFHSFKDVHNKNVCDELVKLKLRGKIKNIGVSVYTNQELEESSQLDFIDTIQMPFNILDNWNLRGKSILLAKKKDKRIQARSVFLQGLILQAPDRLPDFFKPLKPAIAKLQEISIRHGIDMQALALSYVLGFDQINGVVIGVDDADQLEKNIKALPTKLVPAILDAVEELNVKSELLDPRTWKTI